MNGNKLAKTIAAMEGKKKSVDIAQIKEILKLMKKLFKDNPFNILTYFCKSIIILSLISCAQAAKEPLRVEKEKIFDIGDQIPHMRDKEEVLINGDIVEPGKGWDHVIKIQTGSAGCSATIVGPEVIITAAHCANNGSTSTFTYNGKKYSAKMTRSPLYPRKDHDICVGKLEEPIKSDYATIGGENVKGKTLTILGYGCTKPGGGGNDGKLRKGDATIIGFSQFDAVSTNGSALCYGDSGGPEFLLEKGLYLLSAINSKGNIKTTNYGARLDLKESQDFLKDYAAKNKVDICGINKVCNGVEPKETEFELENETANLHMKVKKGEFNDIKHEAKRFMDLINK